MLVGLGRAMNFNQSAIGKFEHSQTAMTVLRNYLRIVVKNLNYTKFNKNKT